MSLVEEFFREIDRRWAIRTTERIPLNVIGSGALMLQAQYERGTRDSDVLETTALTTQIKDALMELAGAGTTLARKHGLYLQIVGNGLPFLPREPLWHPVPSLALERFQVHALDVVDVIVSKLKRFHANDQSDVDAMVEQSLVGHARLVERFRSAFSEFSYDGRAAELKDYVANLNRVERDMLRVEVSDFESELSLLRY